MRKGSVDDGPPRLTGIDYTKVMDRQVGDRRFERERQGAAAVTSKPVSSTFDAFQRLAAGLDGRKIADKIADPNRPTWEQYKKENEEKLDLVGDDVRKMVEYREQLDREREKRLRDAGGRHRGPADSDKDSSGDESDSSSDSDDSSSSSGSDRHRKKRRRKDSSRKSSHKKEKKSKKDKKSSRKHKKHKKDRKHRSDSSSSSDESKSGKKDD